MVYGLLSVLIPHFQDSFTSIQFTNIYGASTVSLGLPWSYSIYKCLLSPYCILGFTLVLFSLQMFTEPLLYWRRKWQPTPVFLPGESHGWRSLVGYSPQAHKESDTNERLHFHFLLYTCVYSGPIQSTSVY